MKTTFLSISIFVVLTFSAVNSCRAQCSNLLVNPGAESGLTDWTFSTGTGTDWAIQGSSFGSSSFVASYNWSTKHQTVDLVSLGYAVSYLDSEPMIYVQEMFTGHTVDFADEYYLHVELRDSLGAVLASYDAGTQSSPLIADASWQTASNTFSSYGPGLRSIYMESGGNDAEFWAGYYGTKMDEAEIKFGSTVNAGITNTSPSLSADVSGAIYQWLDCDSSYAIISGETSQVFTPVNNGNYAVEVTENGCVDTSVCELVYNVFVEESAQFNTTRLFPNPTAGKLCIELGNTHEIVNVSVRTLTGRLVLTKAFKSTKVIRLDLIGDPGMYLLEINDTEGFSTMLKVIKSR